MGENEPWERVTRCPVGGRLSPKAKGLDLGVVVPETTDAGVVGANCSTTCEVWEGAEAVWAAMETPQAG